MPTISVIIPTYNAEKTIEKTVKSVLNQTFTDFEIIVINDGSQDKTLDILQGITDPRLKVFSYPNAGPQKSRNRGIKKASGNYFSFLDADDLWTPDKLEAQLKALENNSDAGVVYSWTDHVDKVGNLVRRGSYRSVEGDILAQLLLVDFIESGSNPLVRREALETVGEFDETLVGGQDWDMWLRLAAAYPFVVVPQVQVFHLMSPTSWSKNVERQEKGFTRVIEKALDNAPETVRKLKNYVIANRYKTLVYDALQGQPTTKRGVSALRWLWVSLKYDPSFLRARVLVRILVKIGVMLVVPASLSSPMINRCKFFSNMDALLGYLYFEQV